MKYRVPMSVTVTRTAYVEADSPEEAKAKAMKFDVEDEGHDEGVTDWEVTGEPTEDEE